VYPLGVSSDASDLLEGQPQGGLLLSVSGTTYRVDAAHALRVTEAPAAILPWKADSPIGLALLQGELTVVYQLGHTTSGKPANFRRASPLLVMCQVGASEEGAPPSVFALCGFETIERANANTEDGSKPLDLVSIAAEIRAQKSNDGSFRAQTLRAANASVKVQ
jgi:hypothetical protein